MVRQNYAPALSSPPGYQAAGHNAPAIAEGSPYALSATDATGHIRKFETLKSEIIRMAISRYDGHMSEVARRLGIGRSTLYRKLKEFGLEGGDAAVEVDTADELEKAIRKAG